MKMSRRMLKGPRPCTNLCLTLVICTNYLTKKFMMVSWLSQSEVNKYYVVYAVNAKRSSENIQQIFIDQFHNHSPLLTMTK